MKRINIITLALVLFSGALFSLYSCSDSDENHPAPTVSLSETTATGKTGDAVEVTVTMTAPAGLESLVVKKFHDSTEKSSETITSFTNDTYAFSYTILAEDLDAILKFNFTATDAEGQTGSKELVVEVEYTKAQLLVKYDWLLSEEVREITSTNDISDAYADDVYRFNEDGTWVRSYGAQKHDFDSLAKSCFWNLNEETNNLILTSSSLTPAWEYEEKRDTINVTLIDATAIEGTVVYYGLDAFNPWLGEGDTPYEAVENYIKKFAAQAKGETFDPYEVGVEDDPEVGFECIEAPW